MNEPLPQRKAKPDTSMIIIYKGTLYEVPIHTPYEITGARLYNLATRTTVHMTLSTPTVEDGIYKYEATITAAETAKQPQGIYNLELYSGEAGSEVIEAYYENYAKIVESSFTQDYA